MASTVLVFDITTEDGWHKEYSVNADDVIHAVAREVGEPNARVQFQRVENNGVPRGDVVKLADLYSDKHEQKPAQKPRATK